MNQVNLVGRLTKDPEVRYTSSQMAVARFTVAVDRQKDKSGEQKTDFISTVCFGKTAELVERYLGKGRLVGVTGSIQTGSYEKDGRKVYTTDVVADRVEFLDKGDTAGKPAKAEEDTFAGFNLTEDDIPF